MKKIRLLLSLSLFLFIGTSFAATVTWTGTTSTDWGTASNWDTGVPVAGDDVMVPDLGTSANYPEVNDTRTVRSIVLENNARLTILVNADLTVNAQDAVTTGIQVNGSVSSSNRIVNQGTLHITNFDDANSVYGINISSTDNPILNEGTMTIDDLISSSGIVYAINACCDDNPLINAVGATLKIESLDAENTAYGIGHFGSNSGLENYGDIIMKNFSSANISIYGINFSEMNSPVNNHPGAKIEMVDFDARPNGSTVYGFGIFGSNSGVTNEGDIIMDEFHTEGSYGSIYGINLSSEDSPFYNKGEAASVSMTNFSASASSSSSNLYGFGLFGKRNSMTNEGDIIMDEFHTEGAYGSIYGINLSSEDSPFYNKGEPASISMTNFSVSGTESGSSIYGVGLFGQRSAATNEGAIIMNDFEADGMEMTYGTIYGLYMSSEDSPFYNKGKAASVSMTNFSIINPSNSSSNIIGFAMFGANNRITNEGEIILDEFNIDGYNGFIYGIQATATNTRISNIGSSSSMKLTNFLINDPHSSRGSSLYVIASFGSGSGVINEGSFLIDNHIIMAATRRTFNSINGIQITSGPDSPLRNRAGASLRITNLILKEIPSDGGEGPDFNVYGIYLVASDSDIENGFCSELIIDNLNASLILGESHTGGAYGIYVPTSGVTITNEGYLSVNKVLSKSEYSSFCGGLYAPSDVEVYNAITGEWIISNIGNTSNNAIGVYCPNSDFELINDGAFLIDQIVGASTDSEVAGIYQPGSPNLIRNNNFMSISNITNNDDGKAVGLLSPSSSQFDNYGILKINGVTGNPGEAVFNVSADFNNQSCGLIETDAAINDGEDLGNFDNFAGGLIISSAEDKSSIGQNSGTIYQTGVGTFNVQGGNAPLLSLPAGFQPYGMAMINDPLVSNESGEVLDILSDPNPTEETYAFFLDEAMTQSAGNYDPNTNILTVSNDVEEGQPVYLKITRNDTGCMYTEFSKLPMIEAIDVPTMNQWALIIFGLIVLNLGLIRVSGYYRAVFEN